MNRIHVGQVIGRKTLVDTDSRPVPIPDGSRLVHLQFRRFAGCPFCSVHLHSFVRRHDDITAANIREVVVFRSTLTALQRHHGGVPFDIVADPGGSLYTDFGVGSGPGALLNPRVLFLALPNVLRMLPGLPGLPSSGESALGLPADFLIATDGKVRACKYGTHADDQWSVDELLAHAHDRGAP
ncbi:alkyl hydroperoxide reductase [Sulfuricaulis limicola]|uniref:Alkyl hydroperoxide reductase n=1 Tax=Sulfuricaulis limicola TaxID=1620215 RepID=A0A1B4XCA0_9GAMM|nr:AhpC/TSA family protein [Sulfuricaulis limicola]BAV32416.1 alkyl hydroperoxide reductase [Sulfuricaulis limicola]